MLFADQPGLVELQLLVWAFLGGLVTLIVYGTHGYFEVPSESVNFKPLSWSQFIIISIICGPVGWVIMVGYLIKISWEALGKQNEN